MQLQLYSSQITKNIFCYVFCQQYSSILWKVKTDNIQCIHLCFCMLAISFYFVNCVIISCELYYDNSFGCILRNYKKYKVI